MARPRKQEVDYFPHYCDHGKVLFILENHFRNDGYAVFYKIQELLAKTEGHCYDCSTVENWEYLLSKMSVEEETVMAIIEKLISMKILDPDLWKEKRIWMQTFVDSIADAYARRKVIIPARPELLHTETPLSGINANNNPDQLPPTVVYDDINPQSKVNKIKEKKIVSQELMLTETPEMKKAWNAFVEMRKKIKKPLTDNAIHLINLELEKIKNTHGHDPAEILNQSTRNSWQDVYPLKDKSPQPNTSPPSGGNGNGNGMARPAAYSDPFTICPRCHKEIQRAHLDGKGCIYCATPKGDIGKLIKGIAQAMSVDKPPGIIPKSPPLPTTDEDDIDFAEFGPNPGGPKP